MTTPISPFTVTTPDTSRAAILLGPCPGGGGGAREQHLLKPKHGVADGQPAECSNPRREARICGSS